MDKDDLRLATLAALRQEIQNRSAAQHTLMSLSVSGFGAVGGIALAKGGRQEILLILPLFSPLLGALYLDHARVIGKLGHRVRQLYGNANEDVVGFEGVVPDRVNLSFSVPAGLLFGLFPVVALIVMFPTYIRGMAPWMAWLLWVAGALMIALFALDWLSVMWRKDLD